ncbi:MAG: DUF2098 domain-containing protein [Methanobacteriaceae archaeon]
MESLDARGKAIEIGLAVRYTGTGTSGIVKDIQKKDGKFWITLEDKDLLYLADTLEIVNNVVDDEKVHKDNNKDALDEVKDIENVRDNLENFAMETNVGEGGG